MKMQLENDIIHLPKRRARSTGYWQQFVDESRVNADETETYLEEPGIKCNLTPTYILYSNYPYFFAKTPIFVIF